MEQDPIGSVSNGTPEQFMESLGRLSKKAGVIATIVLDRPSGTILTSTGTLSPFRSSAMHNSSNETVSASAENEGIQQMASMVWNFVNSTGDLIHGLDAEEEVKLLRLRTKKYELVIVPDSKYLLIVVHETPPS